MLIGGLIALGLYIGTTFAFAAIVALTDRSLQVEDRDVFQAAGDIAEWSDRRLKAAAESVDLPDPPEIWADLRSLQIGLGTTMVYQVGLIAIAGILTRQSPRELFTSFGMNRYDWRGVWRPVVALFVAYTLVVGYGAVMQAFGPDILVPQSTVPGAVVRDDLTLAMTGVLACIAAPMAEESFFRGFMFGGLRKWGFWPAASISAFAFTIAHLDPGSIIPFFGIGLILAYLYRSRGTLWDSILLHFMFNFTSFLFLAASR